MAAVCVPLLRRTLASVERAVLRVLERDGDRTLESRSSTTR